MILYLLLSINCPFSELLIADYDSKASLINKDSDSLGGINERNGYFERFISHLGRTDR